MHTTSAAPRSVDHRRRRDAPWGWIAAAGALAFAAWSWLRPHTAPPSFPPSRLAIVVPGAGSSGNGRLVDISPDGERVVFTTLAAQALGNLVQLDHDQPVRVQGLQNAIDLHFSADGQYVYFGDISHSQLQRASIEGGPAVPVRGVPSSPFIADAPDGSMWLSNTSFELLRVAPDGTMEKRLASVQPKLTVAIMQIFRDGRTALAKDYNTADGQLALLDLESGKLTPLFDFPVVEARYAAGHLVYVRSDGTLHAIAFDGDTHRPSGTSVQLGDNVSLTGSGIAQLAVATNGTIVYAPAQPREVVLVDRGGKETPLTTERRNFHMPRFSPDGQIIALDFPSIDGRDVWTLDRASGTLSRVTADHDAHDPVWSRDGRDLYYTSIRRGGTFGVYRTRPGSGVVTRIAMDGRLSFTGVPLADGRSLITQAIDLTPRSQGDIVRIDSAGHLVPVVAESYDEGYADVSPDGRWMAFVSTLAGQAEVYVRSLAGTGEQVQVSVAGGSEPMWSHDGTELFYRAESDGHTRLVAASIERGQTLRVTRRTALFTMDEYDSAQPHANYDVAPDGKSFVMIHRAPTGRLTVIQNLPELVRRLSGTAKQR